MLDRVEFLGVYMVLPLRGGLFEAKVEGEWLKEFHKDIILFFLKCLKKRGNFF